ncbi:hypothetical protein EI94DRAFT_1735503, partial [Lactarius quietus]
MNGNYRVQSHLIQHTPSDYNLTRPFFQRSVSHQIVNQQGNVDNPVTPSHRPTFPHLPPPSTAPSHHLSLQRGNAGAQTRSRNGGGRDRYLLSHWQQEDHRGYHVYYGRAPKRSQIETYNPWIILNNVKDGAISIHEGKNLAKVLVQTKACALQKADMWTDPWGHNRRQTSTC